MLEYPDNYGISEDDILALPFPKRTLSILRLAGYNVDPLKEMLAKIKKIRKRGTEAYYSTWPEIIRDIFYTTKYAHLESEKTKHNKEFRKPIFRKPPVAEVVVDIKPKRVKKIEPIMLKIKPTIERRVLRTGNTWAITKEKCKNKFKPKLFHNKYKNLDDFATFAEQSEINECCGNDYTNYGK